MGSTLALYIAGLASSEAKCFHIRYGFISNNLDTGCGSDFHTVVINGDWAEHIFMEFDLVAMIVQQLFLLSRLLNQVVVLDQAPAILIDAITCRELGFTSLHLLRLGVSSKIHDWQDF